MGMDARALRPVPPSDEDATILLVEDDPHTARTLCRGLEDRGYGGTHAATYCEAMRLVEERSFRSAVLDLMIPGGSGFDVLRRLRELRRDTPVLILTARDSVGDRVAGLE